MSTKRKYDLENHVHYLTGVVNKRMRLFQKHPGCCQIFLENLNFYRNRLGFKFLGYVIMPEHYHLLIMPSSKSEISKILMVLKGYSAKNIIEFLRNEDIKFLDKFKLPVNKTKRKKDSKYRIFKPDDYDFNIFTQEKLIEKLNYMHNNPVKRGLVEGPTNYFYSSARSYELNDDSFIEIDKLF